MSKLGSITLNEETSMLWEDYAKKYNSLSNMLQKAGIEPKLLREVVDAASELINNPQISK